MMKSRPIKERDVILVYLLGDTQTFLRRVQVYLKTKQKLIALPPASLPVHQAKVEDELIGDPNNISKRLELAVFHEIQDKLSEATGELEEVINLLVKREEDCPDIYIRLGSLYELQGNYDHAHSAYKEGQEFGLKLRPAVCLRKLPPTYSEFLVCGLTTKVNRFDKILDEIVTPNDDNLKKLPAAQSVIRPGFLSRVRIEEITGRIGSISVVRHRRLLKKLSEYLFE
jgi:mRNA interferase MazF